MVTERIDRKEYPSFGECIYCGALANETKLTDEHIIPFSLGGKAVILNGSCMVCAAETAKIESELGRKAFWDFRTHI
jgi:5-methylcytosine-specific restriction endonuclease McrA